MKNNVGIVLDSSGSMDAYRAAVINSFNGTVDAVREGALKEKQVTTVSFWTFGESRHDTVTEKFFNRPVSKLERLSERDYRPNDMTPLFDAVGTAIDRLESLDDGKASFLLIVKTDGGENASRRYNADKLRRLMQRVNATDRWTIAFLVPPRAKRAFCSQFGIPEGNVREWETTARGVVEAQRATTASVGSYFSARSAGQTSTKSFYSDLSAVKPSAVRKSLDDIADDVRIWTVPAEVGISEFVETKSRKAYRKGSAFYQLTKPELVQETKEILVMEKGKSAVYGGEDARTVLGIPEGRIRIKPGNHANFDVFVQSTSFTRKLVRGTKIIVRAAA